MQRGLGWTIVETSRKPTVDLSYARKVNGGEAGRCDGHYCIINCGIRVLSALVIVYGGCRWRLKNFVGQMEGGGDEKERRGSRHRGIIIIWNW